jgi:hypothetical protein
LTKIIFLIAAVQRNGANIAGNTNNVTAVSSSDMTAEDLVTPCVGGTSSCALGDTQLKAIDRKIALCKFNCLKKTRGY